MSVDKIDDDLKRTLASFGAAGSNARFFTRRNTYLAMEYGSPEYHQFLALLKEMHPFRNKGYDPNKDSENDDVIWARIYTGRIFEKAGPFPGSPCWVVEKLSAAPRIRRFVANRIGLLPAEFVEGAREYDEYERDTRGRSSWVRTRCESSRCVRPGHLIVTSGPARLTEADRVPQMPFTLPPGVAPEDLNDLDLVSWIIENLI